LVFILGRRVPLWEINLEGKYPDHERIIYDKRQIKKFRFLSLRHWGPLLAFKQGVISDFLYFGTQEQI
jgi:hypothetical protein